MYNTNTKLKLGPIRLRFSGLSTGVAVTLVILVALLALTFLVGMVALLVHNLWIAYTGEATGWNFLFIVLLAFFLVYSAKGSDDK